MGLVLSLAFVLAVQGADLSPEAFNVEASDWLLAGEGLPVDWRYRLKMMEPADRLLALIFLRRSGLLVGQGWAVEDILTPALDLKNDEEPD